MPHIHGTLSHPTPTTIALHVTESYPTWQSLGFWQQMGDFAAIRLMQRLGQPVVLFVDHTCGSETFHTRTKFFPPQTMPTASTQTNTA